MEQSNEKKIDASGAGKVVKTYAEDMAEVIENDKAGLVKKIIHGEEQHEEEKKNLSPESRKNKFFMFISLLFIALGFAILFFFMVRSEISSVPVEKQFIPLIFNDKSSFVEVADFGKDKIAQTVLNKVDTTEVKAGGIEGIYLSENKKVVGFQKFISLIKGNFFPESNSVNDNFMMGAVNRETKDFFILLKVRSIPDVFDALRVWENKMFLDLHGFFAFPISPETRYLLTKDFDDGIVDNKNARILHTNDDKIVLMYILADDNFIIITNTENAAHEIMIRLASSKVKK